MYAFCNHNVIDTEIETSDIRYHIYYFRSILISSFQFFLHGFFFVISIHYWISGRFHEKATQSSFSDPAYSWPNRYLALLVNAVGVPRKQINRHHNEKNYTKVSKNRHFFGKHQMSLYIHRVAAIYVKHNNDSFAWLSYYSSE